METIAGMTAPHPPEMGKIHQTVSSGVFTGGISKTAKDALVTLQVERSDFQDETFYSKALNHFRKLYFINKDWFLANKHNLSTVFPSFIVVNAWSYTDLHYRNTATANSAYEQHYRSSLFSQFASVEVRETVDKLFKTHYLLLPIRRYKTTVDMSGRAHTAPEFIGCRINKEYSSSGGSFYYSSDFKVIDVCIAGQFGRVPTYEYLGAASRVDTAKRSTRLKSIISWADEYLNEFMAMGGF